MHRAEKFLEDLADHALTWMEKDIEKMHPREIDYLASVCDLHAGVCEFIELVEKRGSNSGVMSYDNPHRRRR